MVEMVTPNSPLTTIDWKNAERARKRRNHRALVRNCRQAGRQRRHPNPVWNLPLLSAWTSSDVMWLSLTAADDSKLFGTMVFSVDAKFAMGRRTGCLLIAQQSAHNVNRHQLSF